MVMNTYALLKSGGTPTKKECMDVYDGNICRCTGYRNLTQATESFAADASPEAKAIAQKFGPDYNADADKVTGAEHAGMSPRAWPRPWTSRSRSPWPSSPSAIPRRAFAA